MNIGIAGAGLLGRLAGFQLLRMGHQVTLFEASPTAAPAPGSLRAAAWTSAGMLSPIAEMECGGALVRDLGLRSLELWKSIDAQLAQTLGSPASPLRSGPSLPTSSPETSPLGLALNDSLMVCHASDIGSAQRVLRLLDQDGEKLIQLDAQEAKFLAPMLKGTLHAWRLCGEGHLHPVRAMQNLHSALVALGATWHFDAKVSRITSGLIHVNGKEYNFDLALDARGTGASSDISVRGVRGEVLLLSAPGFELHRPVRLLHPRWRVYIVPRDNDQVIIGATEIESEDLSPISVQSAMELLSAAFSIFPTLAEARIVHADVNLRPAMPDNMPLIDSQPGLIRINGLFRHGWLLAPAVCEKAFEHASLH